MPARVALSRPGNGSLASVVLRAQVRARIDENSTDPGLAVLSCAVKRRVSFVISRI